MWRGSTVGIWLCRPWFPVDEPLDHMQTDTSLKLHRVLATGLTEEEPAAKHQRALISPFHSIIRSDPLSFILPFCSSAASAPITSLSLPLVSLFVPSA